MDLLWSDRLELKIPIPYRIEVATKSIPIRERYEYVEDQRVKTRKKTKL